MGRLLTIGWTDMLDEAGRRLTRFTGPTNTRMWCFGMSRRVQQMPKLGQSGAELGLKAVGRSKRMTQPFTYSHFKLTNKIYFLRTRVLHPDRS